MDQWVYGKLGVFPEGMKHTPFSLLSACKLTPHCAQGILPTRFFLVQPYERRAHRGLPPYSSSPLAGKSSWPDTL